LSEFGDALRDRDQVNSQMHLEALIEQVWTCTWWPGSSELRDPLGGRNRVGLDMDWEADIE